ncbi:MAG: pitrilysin family protein [archaeon]
MKSEFHKTVLKNGLTILFEKRNLPIVNILYSSRFGSAYESDKLKGVAHLIEHMVFKGTKNRNQKEIAKEIEGVGGVINAFTAQQQTTFWDQLPSKYYTKGFEIISDIMTSPLFDKKELEKEKKVVFEEQKRWRDLPEHYIFLKIRGLLYNNPFGSSPLGTSKTLTEMDSKTILDFHQNNLSRGILTVVGNANFEEIINNAEAKLKQTNVKISLPEIMRKNGSSIENREGLNQTHIALGMHMPSLSQKDRYAAEIISNILGGGMSSRLWQEIRERRSMAYSVNAAIEQEKDYGHMIIYAGIENSKLKDAKEIILKEIKKLQQLNRKDIEESKEQLIGNFLLHIESGVNVAQNLVLNEIAGDAEEFYNYDERISKVSLEDVKRISDIKDYSFAALVPMT